MRGYRAVSPADGTAQYLQVFPSGSFGDLIRGLRSSVGGGGAAVSKIATETVANSHFGVAGGRSVVERLRSRFRSVALPPPWSRPSKD